MASEVSENEESLLLSLPNEVLIQILSQLRSPALLSVCTVNRQFYSLILRIHAARLYNSTWLKDRMLLLESYHPSQGLFEPYMQCTYLGTDGVDECLQYSDSVVGAKEEARAGQRLKQINALYSRFRVRRRKVEAKAVRKHPAGDVPGSNTWRANSNAAVAPPSGQAQQPQDAASSGGQDNDPGKDTTADAETGEPVKQLAQLDGGTYFTQLCVRTMLAIPGPRHGVFYGLQDVSKGGKEGKLFMRVFRKYLAEQALVTASAENEGAEEATEAIEKREPTDREAAIKADGSICWVCDGYNVGIRFSVKDRSWQRQPVLQHVDEDDIPVAYDLQYDELLVRTASLLRASEQLEEQQRATSGRHFFDPHVFRFENDRTMVTRD